MVKERSVRQRIRFGCWGVGLVAALSVAAGCTSTAAPAAPVATTTAILAVPPVPAAPQNDLQDNSAHHEVALDGETFRLKVDYFTTVDATTWTVLGPKNVHLLAYLSPVQGARAPDVLIDRFDAQFSLLAANPDLDGLVTDVAQDAAGSQIPGFGITAQISYGTVVSTGGVTDALLGRWQSLGGPLPVTETALVQAGVYAVRVSFVYRLLVRNAGDVNWHRRTVLDQLTVPVKSTQAVPTPTS